MELLRQAWLLAQTDLRLYFRDRTAVLLGFLLPAALVAIFGYVMLQAFGGGGSMGRAELWYADLDRTPRSEAFVASLRQASSLRLRPEEGAEPETEESLRERLAEGSAHHALVIPAGFGATLEAGGLPELRMLRDPGRSIEDMLVSVGLTAAYMEQTEGRAWPAMLGRLLAEAGVAPAQVEQVVAAAEATRSLMERFLDTGEADDGGGPAPAAAPEGGGGEDGPAFDMQKMLQDMVPLEIEDHTPPERPENLTHMVAQSVSGIIVMMLMFGLVHCGASLIEERDRGTLARLLAAPVRRDAILLGKFLYTGIIGLCQLAVLFAFGEMVFHAGFFRDPVTLVVLSLSLAAAVTAFGVLVAAWARSRSQAEGFSTLVILVMSAVGGAWFPVQLFDLPLPAQVAMRCTLTHWAMTGYQGMLWNNLSWTSPSILGSLAVLWGFAVAAGLLAGRLFRRNYLAG